MSVVPSAAGANVDDPLMQQKQQQNQKPSNSCCDCRAIADQSSSIGGVLITRIRTKVFKCFGNESK